MKTKILVVGILFLMVVTCAPPTPQELLVGKWKINDVNEKTLDSVEFLQDGRMILNARKDVASPFPDIVGSWAILDDGRLEINATVMGEKIPTEFDTFNFPDKDTLVLGSSVEHPMTRISSSNDSGHSKAEENKVASSAGVIGMYGGRGCVYQKLEFREGGKLYISVAGMEFPATYESDGDKISFTAGDGRGLVFTKKGNTLDGGFAGICTKLL